MNKIIFFLNSKSILKKTAIIEVLNIYFRDNFLIKERLLKINVSETPINKTTFFGATERAKVIKKFFNKSEKNAIFIGLESGLVKRYSFWFEECWCCLIYKNKFYYGYSSGLSLPKIVLKKLKEKKHVEIMKELEQKNKILSKDTWAHYSNNKISRKESIKEAFRNALISLLNENKL